MQKGWTGTKWFIDIDIKGYFNNINHDILMELLKKRIEDSQFLDLIRDMLKAGYVEDWQYHKTYSGTPQGGIVSPILANIYLHEFDEFMEQKKQEFDQGKARRQTNRMAKYDILQEVLPETDRHAQGRPNPETHLIQRYEAENPGTVEKTKTSRCKRPARPRLQKTLLCEICR